MVTRSLFAESIGTNGKLAKPSSLALGKEIRVFRSVDEIGRDSMDSLSDDGFFTYGWFKTLETQQSFDCCPFYLAVYDKDKLVAVAPCFADLQDHFFVDGPRIIPFAKKLLSLGRKIGLWQDHVLLCYSPFCLRSKVLLGKTREVNLILRLLSKKIDEICKKKGFLFSSFLAVSEFDRLLMKNLRNLGYLRFPGTTTLYLDVKWSSFEDYLKSLKRKTRKNIRREIRKCTGNGVTIEKREISGLSAKLSELLSNHISKYLGTVDNPFDPDFFNKLNIHARDKIKVFIAKKNNEVVGFTLLTQQKVTLDAWMCGFNYDALTNTDFIYFNLAYYAPIRWAIDEGIKKIYYRTKAEKVKLDRGCKPERTYSFVKCHNRLIAFLIRKALRNILYSYLRARFLRQALS
jgi:predicted N-acyltransferase